MEIVLALDWTPNTNHTGFYVAQAQGLYERAGLSVRIVSADEDDYATTPAKKVATGAATFAISPSESVISFHTLDARTPLVAIAAIVQRDTSAIVTLRESGRDRPATLDGATYASYGARFEDAIVAQMIRNDGGRGEFTATTPPKLGIWNTLLAGDADATWVFMPWEGVEAEWQGVELNAFRLADYNIPYGYTPLLLAHPDTIAEQADAVRAFVQASAAGFQFAAANPDAAADLLVDTSRHPTLENREFVRASQRVLAGEYLNAQGGWGTMERARWQQFVDWLAEQRILKTTSGQEIGRGQVDVGALFTNAFVAG